MKCLMVLMMIAITLRDFVKASWVLEARLVNYTNPGNIDFQGSCCDPHSLCLSPCDVYFTFCLRSIDTSPTNPGDCQQLVTTTRWHTATTGEIRPPTVGPLYDGSPISNPIRFSGNTWSGSFQLLVSTEDADSNADDLIDRNAFNQQISPTGAWTEVYRKLGYYQAAHVAMQFKVWCGQHYYTQSCSVYCKAQDDNVEGHYNCNSEGGKVCLTGWSDPDNINCLTPICAEGCRNGGCNEPGECSCLSGWFGELCDDCHPGFSCSAEHGRCITTPGECVCDSGYGGANCDQDLDVCGHQQPCLHGATCSNEGPDQHSCSCVAGYTGNNCHTEINKCDSLPCPNGATCNDLVNGYSCQCEPGWTGAECDVDIDECQSIPCQNNASCENLVGDYSCTCPDQYRGKDCEYNEQIPQCSPNPCPRGLTCAEGTRTDYVCIQCSDKGADCNFVIDSEALAANATQQGSTLLIGAAVGGFGGALLLVCLLVVITVCCCRTAKNTEEPYPQDDEKGYVPNPTYKSTTTLVSTNKDENFNPYDVPDYSKDVPNPLYASSGPDTTLPPNGAVQGKTSEDCKQHSVVALSTNSAHFTQQYDDNVYTYDPTEDEEDINKESMYSEVGDDDLKKTEAPPAVQPVENVYDYIPGDMDPSVVYEKLPPQMPLN